MVLRNFFNVLLQVVEKAEFGTEFIKRELDVPYDNETHKAVLSIILGARIHDAAVMLNVSDGTMRDRFNVYCKHANPALYENLCYGGEAHYTEHFQQPQYIFDFFSRSQLRSLLPQLEESPALPSPAELKENLDRAVKEVSESRIKMSVANGIRALLNN